MLQDDGMDDYGSGDDALDGVEALDGYGELALLMGLEGPSVASTWSCCCFKNIRQLASTR